MDIHRVALLRNGGDAWAVGPTMTHKRERGVCKVCGQDKQVRKDGKIARHQSSVNWDVGSCKGSGRFPANEKEILLLNYAAMMDGPRQKFKTAHWMTQIGWLGQTGAFYPWPTTPTKEEEPGSYSPVYIDGFSQ